MKVKILKKTIKEGDNYCIKSLFVSFTEEEIYNKIIAYLKSLGAAEDKISSFCKPNEYNGAVSYAFGLNCSNFTFDRVKRFGVLDATVIFQVNDKGFINAKIQVVEKKEQILSYEEPEDDVVGWATQTPVPEPVKVEPMGDGSHAEPNPVVDFAKLAADAPEAATDLPF